MSAKTPLPGSSLISFWLVPCESNLRELTALINFLADKYSAPRFLPHVTLLVTQLEKDRLPLQILESASKGVAPLKLELLGLDHSPDRFKSVFIRLNSEPVLPLYAALCDSCQHSGSYRLDAHLSLLYLQLSVMKRISLISDLEIPQGPLQFDTVIAVRPGRKHINFDDVEKWRLTDQIVLTAT